MLRHGKYTRCRPEPKTGNLFEQPKRDRFWPDDLELDPESLEKAHMQMIGADYNSGVSIKTA